MSNLKNLQRKLAEGVSSWLQFEFSCMRGTLFNEKYLSYPIGQILTGMKGGTVISEFNHPLLDKLKKSGRPAQIDFVLLDDDSNWECAIESKWVGKTDISLESILWDLIRLQKLVDELNVKCYFILAGRNKRMKQILEQTHLSNSTCAKITTITPHELVFNLTLLNDKQKSNLNKRFLKYEGLTFSNNIYCKPFHKYPTEIINMSFTTFVWEVTKSKTPMCSSL
jgi:hypothetical protein